MGLCITTPVQINDEEGIRDRMESERVMLGRMEMERRIEMDRRGRNRGHILSVLANERDGEIFAIRVEQVHNRYFIDSLYQLNDFPMLLIHNLEKKTKEKLSSEGKKRLEIIVCKSDESDVDESDVDESDVDKEQDTHVSYNGNSECYICFNSYKKGEELYKLPCNCTNLCHASCLDKWFQKECVCPICKFNINTGCVAPTN